MKHYILNNKLTFVGIAIGLVTGFLYWKLVGCASGTCMITSKPINSSLYGALMGGLVFSMFNNKKENNAK
jgi:LytS/YehU family sensor histidine kinase